MRVQRSGREVYQDASVPPCTTGGMAQVFTSVPARMPPRPIRVHAHTKGADVRAAAARSPPPPPHPPQPQ